MITQELCRFLVETGYDAIPAKTIERAKELILDFVGVSVAGQTAPAGRIVDDFVRRTGPKEATVIGGGFKSSAAGAAYANGTLDHVLELEAVAAEGGPNTAMSIPSALALAERRRLSGKALLEAFILGYEVQSRVFACMPGMPKRGWNTGSVSGIVGAAASASRALGLSAERAAAALSLALSQAGGIGRQTGTMLHFLEFGMAARAGVEGAELAAAGAVAATDILDGNRGFAELYAGSEFNLEKAAGDLGSKYFISDPGVSVKKYPCCYRNHRVLDTVALMLAENKIAYEQISRVNVDLGSYDYLWVVRYLEPRSSDEAKFCLPYVVGALILDGKMGLDSIADDKMTDPRYAEARLKVHPVLHKEWPSERESYRAGVSIELKDGKSYSREALWTPRNPTREEQLQRYRECASRVLSKEAVERSLDMILGLEKVRDVGSLTRLVKGPGE